MGLSVTRAALVCVALGALGQPPEKPRQAPASDADQRLIAGEPGSKSMPLELTGKQWTFRSRGPWQDLLARRGLRAMRYPWRVSSSGEHAELSRSITIPADWQPPYTLTFFCSDD